MYKEFDINECLAQTITWAKEVGKIHLEYFRKKELSIETKSSSYDLLTIADKLSEEYIVEQIRHAYPDHQVLAEESGLNEMVSDFCWVIDPVDGTTNFAQGIPIFSVSIGLRYRGKGIMGVVYAPFMDELFYAIKGQGVFHNGKPIHVSNKTELHQSLLCTGFPYDHGTNPDNNTDNIARILPHCRDIRRLGSAAYDLCCIAAGYFDGFWEMNLKDWDVAAATVIIEEAGGQVIRFRKEPNYCIIAANALIVGQMQEYIK
ncbi:inositol monophosphatase family protein [Parabacteroides sp. FAFU027]|uniref:inositol monophosphatase family protein n=1 Tax=Parabacteroides sp. FAFU027 TaxID=2922715 RepID=UPI001FAFF67C|nr:inositol monophosphatase family protein [Parabacteroides sp. FAFU027]